MYSEYSGLVEDVEVNLSLPNTSFSVADYSTPGTGGPGRRGSASLLKGGLIWFQSDYASLVASMRHLRLGTL